MSTQGERPVTYEEDGSCYCFRCEKVHPYCECDEYAYLGTHSLHAASLHAASGRPHPMGE